MKIATFCKLPQQKERKGGSCACVVGLEAEKRWPWFLEAVVLASLLRPI